MSFPETLPNYPTPDDRPRSTLALDDRIELAEEYLGIARWARLDDPAVEHKFRMEALLNCRAEIDRAMQILASEAPNAATA